MGDLALGVPGPADSTMLQRQFQLLSLAVALGVTSCNVIPEASVTPRYASLEASGDLGISGAGALVTSDVETLGLDDEGALAPRLDFSWLSFDAWVSYYDVEYSGDGTAEGQFDLGGVVITGGTPVRTELDLLLATAGLTYDFIPTDLVDLSLGAGYGFVDYDASLTSLLTSEVIQSDESFGLPLLAARGAVEFLDCELSLVIAGLGGEVEGDEVLLLDGDLMFSWDFLDAGPAQGGLVLGYRLTSIEAEYGQSGSRIDAELEFAGPYAGLTLSL